MNDYERLISQIRETVELKLPPSAIVAVASRGDEEMLALGSRTARCLPAAEDGSFLGGHPADSQDAIRQLILAQKKGADYFLLPAPQLWWREYYHQFQVHLERDHELVWDGDDCVVYKLLKPQPLLAEIHTVAETCAGVIARLQWTTDRLLLDDLVFRIEHAKNDQWELGDQCFGFYKVKGLIDAYAQFWNTRPTASVRNIVELGIWDGGSSAFWFEFFHPEKLIAIDWSPKQDSEYFKHYVRSRGLAERLKTYWGIDQADSARLSSIVNAEFERPLDLVIDDASHLYGPTRTSFEVLFPRLRPGGIYIIEDWAWDHWPEFHAVDGFFGKERRLTDLVWEFVEAIGTRGGLINNMTVGGGFVAIERGWKEVPESGFNLESHIVRRPQRAAEAKPVSEVT